MADNTDRQSAHRTAETAYNVAESYVERFITYIVGRVTDMRAIEALIKDLSPLTATLIYEGLPGAVGLAVSQLPDVMFKSPESAQFVRSMVNEAAKNIADKVREKRAKGGGEVTAAEKEKAVDDAFKTVSDRELVVDPLNHLHQPTCVSLRHFEQKNLLKIKFEDALRQKLPGSPCCFERIGNQFAAPPAAPPATPTPKKNLSFFEVYGGASEGDRKRFDDWLNSLPAAERPRAVELLEELDSQAEFDGFMSLTPERRLEMLPLLAERHGKFALRKFLGILGTLARAGFDHAHAAALNAWNGYRAFDARLQPAVDREWRQFTAPRKRNPWWRMFFPF